MKDKVLFWYLKFFIFFAILLPLVGCPRYAYVELYNHSGVTIEVSASGITKTIDPDQTEKFELTGRHFEVHSQLGYWVYPRNIPNMGEDGPYFKGTLRVQLNKNGDLYALKETQRFPVDSFDDQPIGYPLSATKINNDG